METERERNTLCSFHGLRSERKHFKQSIGVVISVSYTPTMKKQEASSLYNNYYWSGCLCAFLRDKNHNKVLDIPVVARETVRTLREKKGTFFKLSLFEVWLL